VPTDDDAWLRTTIGASDPDRITVAGRDLPSEVMGHLTLTELAYLLITGWEASPGQRRMLDAVLVSLADHGFTPSALATRLTYTGAPESVQGAVAAGLLGAGSVFLGPAGDTAQFLADALAGHDGDVTAGDLGAVADAAVAGCRARGVRVPGLGHPVHRAGDPRTARIYELAEEVGTIGPHLRLLRAVADAYARARGRGFPINGAGAGGAALVDAGLPPTAVRGFVLIGRTAGLVAHLAEERVRPVGMPLYLEIEERARRALDQSFD
jgi:citrate synthase